MLFRVFAPFLLLLVTLGPVQARDFASTFSLGVKPAAGQDNELLELARAAIGARRDQFKLLYPTAAANLATPEAVIEKIDALHDLDRFARDLVTGLAAAASEGDRASISEALRPVLEDLDRNNLLTLSHILKSPAVKDIGWVTVSRFGASAERKTGELLAATGADTAFALSILTRIQELARQGEASQETLDRVSQVAAPAGDISATVADHAG
ncbi:MAG: hypothetical protein SFV19_13050 [Rhodospirillaceae bacterium]|nr:hypothetical protein [Rhodospirillaceae bacterium]